MNKFHLYPAIDLKNGKCVRLLHGDFQTETVYETDVLKQVEWFINKGCKWLHVVDLNSALGLGNNEDAILKIIKSFNKQINIQLGGGVRSYDKIKYWIDKGITRVIIGTLAYESPDIINSLGKDYNSKLVLGIDVRKNRVAIHGWKNQLDLNPFSIIKRLDKSLISSIIYTDIERDGSLEGANINQTLKFSKSIDLPIIASGGISDIKEIIELYNLNKYGIVGVVVGKAIYEKRVSLDEINKIIYP
tara:strand:- start:375 stop:1112 length:738 start_codon:yes stop_codon:yes gene_type:complete